MNTYLIVFYLTLGHMVMANSKYKKSGLEPFVRISKSDDWLRPGDDTVLVSYSCPPSTPSVLGFEALLDDTYSKKIVFSVKWACSSVTDGIKLEYKEIRVQLPPRLQYKPDLLSREYEFQDRIKLRVWMLSVYEYKHIKRLVLPSRMFEKTMWRSQMTVKLDSPFSRPSRIANLCLDPLTAILYSIELKTIYQCDYEKEIVEIVSFPLPLNGKEYGMIAEIAPYSDPYLELERQNKNKNFQFSLVMWMYIEEYCPRSTFCAIYQRFDHDQNQRTPNIYISDKGTVLVEVFDKYHAPHGASTFRSMPLQDWCRYVFMFRSFKWEMHVNCRSNFSDTIFAEYYYPSRTMVYNDVETLANVGGSPLSYTFRGYIGKLTLYRHHWLDPEQLKPLPDDHEMFQLDLKNWNQMCSNYMKRIRYFTYRALEVKHHLTYQKKCPRRLFFESKQSKPKQCSALTKLSKIIKTKDDLELYERLRSIALNASSTESSEGMLDRKSLGKYLLSVATEELSETGFARMDSLIKKLRESSCLGNHEASFMLSVIHLHGIGLNSTNNSLAWFYLMRAVLDSDRLSLLALGHKHTLGLDGIPINYDQAYYFYIQMANKAKNEIYSPIPDENFPDLIRLTDQETINSIATEDNDVFAWLKNQAKKGVVSSQEKLALLMYWGYEGMKRNLEAGAQLFKLGAASKDPQATYNYGLSLLKGHGVKQNVEEALENLKAAAELGQSTSYAALGYHAYEIEKNAEKAAEYWTQGWTKYEDIDCAFNIGFLWSNGRYYNEPKSMEKAWSYWSYAATRGQVDAQLKAAEFFARGYNVVIRDPHLANEWARYLGEQSSIVGKYLNQAILAYKQRNWPVALLYYLMTASTGLEIGCFNAAYICEQNPDNLVTDYFKRECMWNYYNQSVYTDIAKADPYSLNKMGDYFAQIEVNTSRAVELYSRSYLKGEQQGLFNLALMIEEGIPLDSEAWMRIGSRDLSKESNYTQLLSIYQKCLKDEDYEESFIPCTIAYYHTKARELLFIYGVWIKICVAMILTGACLLIANLIRNRYN